MTTKMKSLGVLVAITGIFATAARTMAGGAVSINWENAQEQNSSSAAPFYDHNQTTLLSAGVTNVLGDGFLLQLVGVQGTNVFVLASATVGDNFNNIAGDLQQGFVNSYNGILSLTTSIPSNTLQAAQGTVLGIRFYDATTIAAAQYFGIVSNVAIAVPNPNWATPPLSATLFEPDWSNAAFQGARTANLGQNLSGFYADTLNPLYVVPEPSSIFLVGLGLVGAYVARRRKIIA